MSNVESAFRIKDQQLYFIECGGEKKYLEVISAIKFGPNGLFFTEGIDKIERIIKNKGKSFEHEDYFLQWLKETIFILEETGRKFVDSPYLSQELVRKYWRHALSAYFSDANNREVQEYYRDALEKYFHLCVDDRNYDWFKKNKLDREEEILSLVFPDWKKSDYYINRTILDDVDGILQEAIKRWFLGNYDTFHLRKFESLTHKKKNQRMSDIPGNKPMQVSAEENKAIKLKFDIFYNCGWFLIPFVSLIILSLELLPQWFLDIFSFSLSLVLILALVILIATYQKRHSTLMRLFGCILAGYIPLITTDFSRFASSQTWLTGAFIWGILGVFTFIYIYKEIFNKIQRNKLHKHLEKAARKKAISFLMRSAGYSLIIGIFINDFFSSVSFSCESAKHLMGFQFLLGRIYPWVIINLAPLAMFIGIFINLLWEDKALTEPM